MRSSKSQKIPSKLRSLTGLRNALWRDKRAGRKIVFTNGCFDILHVGHVEYLSKARKMGDVLVIGLNSDRSVKQLKGKDRPINREEDRSKLLSAFYFVDYVTIFNEDTPDRLIRKLKPDILVKGGDWQMKDIVGASFVKSYGGRVATVPFVKGFSTTSLVKKMSGN